MKSAVYWINVLASEWAKFANRLEIEFGVDIKWRSGDKPTTFPLPLGSVPVFEVFEECKTISMFTIPLHDAKSRDFTCIEEQDVLFHKLGMWVGVSVAAETNTNEYPHTCPYCGSPAYIGFLYGNIDCTKGCK